MKQLVLDQVATSLSRALQSDPIAFKTLERIQGQQLLVSVSDWHQHCQLTVVPDGVQLFVVRPSEVTEVAAALRGPAAAFLTALAWRKPGLPPGLEVSGDLVVLQVWQGCLKRLKIDWAALLSPLLGDVWSQNVSDGMGIVLQHAKAFWGARKQDVQDHAVSGAGPWVSQAEAEVFFEDVSHFRDDVARLEAKWQRLRPSGKEKA